MLEATSWWLAPALISLAASSIIWGLVFWLLNMFVSATRPVKSAVAISVEIVIGGLMDCRSCITMALAEVKLGSNQLMEPIVLGVWPAVRVATVASCRILP